MPALCYYLKIEIEQTRMITVPWAQEVELHHGSNMLMFLPGASPRRRLLSCYLLAFQAEALQTCSHYLQNRFLAFFPTNLIM